MKVEISLKGSEQGLGHKTLCSVVSNVCDPVDCSPPGSSVHGIPQTRVLEWVAIPFSRGPSRPGDGPQVSGMAGALGHCGAEKMAADHPVPKCDGPRHPGLHPASTRRAWSQQRLRARPHWPPEGPVSNLDAGNTKHQASPTVLSLSHSLEFPSRRHTGTFPGQQLVIWPLLRQVKSCLRPQNTHRATKLDFPLKLEEEGERE